VALAEGCEMALTAAETTLLYELLGIPECDDGLWVPVLASMSGAFAETFDWASIKDDLETRLAAMAADGTGREARIQTHLSTYSGIAQDPMEVTQSASGAAGRLVDRPAQVERLRDAVGTILGISVPSGGFIEEMRRRTGGGPRIVR
jgi:hypothetical protein